MPVAGVTRLEAGRLEILRGGPRVPLGLLDVAPVLRRCAGTGRCALFTVLQTGVAASVWHPLPDHDDLVFSTQFGTPIEPRNAARSFARIAGRAGLDGASLHTLRHSAASALIASGVHVRIVQEVLGHSTYAVTADTYAHIAVAQQREAAERLGEAFQW